MTSWLRGLGRKDAAIIACGALGAVAAVVLLAWPALWYVGGAGAGPGRHHDVFADLGELSALDARWEREALRALNDFAPTPPIDSAAPLAGLTKRLEAAAKETGSPALQRSLPDVVRAFAEKAEIVGRFEKAHGASGNALREALAMEGELAGMLREAWRDSPDRQRLVAADNVVTQLLADAQRYYFAPAESIRKNLEASTGDLRSAAEALPGTLKPATVRLERHVSDLLRARPQEQAYFDRIRFHNAGPRVATLARELRRELDQHQLRRDRHRVYLTAYFYALLVLFGYLVARLMRRELASRRSGVDAAGSPREQGLLLEPTLPPPPDAAPGP